MKFEYLVTADWSSMSSLGDKGWELTCVMPWIVPVLVYKRRVFNETEN